MRKSTSKELTKAQRKHSKEEQKQCCCSSETTSQSPNIAKEKEDKVRKKAYELYEQNGYQPGCDQENWLEAEKTVCNQ